MFHFSPLTVKRFRSFRRIKRAWYSLIALGVIFFFCLIAELVCPVKPDAIADPASLERFRETESVTTYDVKTVRFNRAPDGTIYDFEGPAEVAAKLTATPPSEWASALHIYGTDRTYDIAVTERDGYTRYYLEPTAAPEAHVTTTLAPVSFPFHPCWDGWRPVHPFGLDAGGRDVYSLVVHGMRIGLLFGIVLAVSGMFIGLVFGAVEGYFGGLVDICGQRFTEIWSAVPFLYVMIFVGDRVGHSFGVLLFCYAIFNWISVSYYVRAEFLRLRLRIFVEAAKCQGFSAARIIFGHILPNALTPLITLFPFLLMGSIGSLAALDFLGFGLPPMTPSCGQLLNQVKSYPSAWWLIVFPSAALFIVMLLTVLVGEGLRDAFDPRQKSKLE